MTRGFVAGRWHDGDVCDAIVADQGQHEVGAVRRPESMAQCVLVEVGQELAGECSEADRIWSTRTLPSSDATTFSRNVTPESAAVGVSGRGGIARRLAT